MRYLWGTALTANGCAANNRAATDGNRTTLQKVFIRGEEFTAVNSESVRFSVRKSMFLDGAKCNRQYDAEDNYTLADPTFKNFAKTADDPVFGCMSATKTAQIKHRGQLSVSRAVSMLPFMQEFSFNCVGGKEKKQKGDLTLYEAEVHTTAYQYTFGMNVAALPDRSVVPLVLNGIIDICPVGGNHARFSYDFSPESLVLRVTNRHSPRIHNCFTIDDVDQSVSLERLLFQIEAGDIPASEIAICGRIVTDELAEKLKAIKVYSSKGVNKGKEWAIWALNGRPN